MKNYLIADRYARALSRSLPDDAELERAVEALRGLSELYESSQDLRNVLSNPSIQLKTREAVLSEVLERESVPAPVARLAEVLLRRARISVLPDVATLFASIADERMNLVTAKVASAVEMDESARTRLAAALERFCGKAVRMECRVDPEVLGGAVARMGSVVVDGSVRTRLESLRRRLLTEEAQ